MSAEDKIIFKYGDDNANPRFEDSYYVSTWVQNKLRIKEGAKMDEKGEVTLTLPISRMPGDRFYSRKYNIKYYIKKWKAFHPYGGHILVIGRVDGYPLTQVDLDNLTTDTEVEFEGFVDCPKNSCK